MTPEARAQKIVKALLAPKDVLIPDDYDFVARHIREAVQAAYEDAAQVVEQRRMRVLANANDPSWTEHFAELQNDIRARAKEVLR